MTIDLEDIGPVVADDIPALQDVLRATSLFPAEMLPEMFAPSQGTSDAAIWLCLRHDARPIGFCYLTPEEMTEGTWNMLALAVHPDFQGHGGGGALVRAAEHALRDAGHRLLIVDTSGTPDFADTRAFYAHAGYVEEARIRNFWAAGDDKVTFSKML